MIGRKLKKCVTVFCEDLFLIVYCPDKYETQRMCDKAVDDCLAALKFVFDCFFISKMIEKFDNDDILFLMKILRKLHFLLIKNILAVDFEKINLDNGNDFDENNLNTIIYVKHLAWHSNLENKKYLNMWHHKR